MTDKKKWFEDEKLWETIMPILFDKPRMENAAREVDGMIDLTGVRPGDKIMDLCCGIGRHSIDFAKRGYDVTGVNKSKLYLKTAAAEAEKQGLLIKLVDDDMRSYCSPESFDLVISYFSSFGYFDSKEDDSTVVKNVFNSLRKGGKFLLDIVGKEVIARNYQRKDWREEKGYTLLEHRMIEEGWSRIHTKWIIFKNGGRMDLNIFHRLYSATEVVDLLRRIGFTDVKVYGDIAGGPYDADARRLITVATK